MRTIKQVGQFKRDLKREAKGQYRATLAKEFVKIVETLAKDMPLVVRFRDHALTGDWRDHLDCHATSSPTWC
jgi:mRNA interferase YafQ